MEKTDRELDEEDAMQELEMLVRFLEFQHLEQVTDAETRDIR